MADSQPPAEPGRASRRRHRRVTRPATGGDPQRALGDLAEEPVDEEWAGAGGSAKDAATQEAEREAWWRAQRPPHWG